MGYARMKRVKNLGIFRRLTGLIFELPWFFLDALLALN
jgi:hypothetical protein